MKKIYFASDAHLGNRYAADPMADEKRLVRWMDRIAPDAAAIYFLGDMFDYWYEYRYVVPRGHVRFLGKLAELHDAGVEIHLFIGNHDIWMFDYLPAEVGAVIHRGPLTVELLGRRFFLAHGDEVGHQPRKYRFIQRIFRNRLCQVLYAGIHPRWTFGFARGWSLSSRRKGLADTRRAAAQERNTRSLDAFARTYLQSHPETDFFLFGHLHLMLDRQLTPQTRMIVLGDWMQYFSYAVWDGLELRLLQDEG